MLRLMPKLAALTIIAALGGVLLAADEKVEPAKLIKLAEVANAGGGIVSPDGKLIAVTVIEKYEKKNPNGMASGSYHRVRLLEAAGGKELAVIPGASALRFSNDGQTLCVLQSFDEQFIKSGNLFGAISILAMPQLWNIANPQKPKQLFVVDSAVTESFSADGKTLLVAGGPEQKFGNAGKVVTGLPKTGAKAGGVGAAGGNGLAGGGGFAFGAGVSTRFCELWDVDSAKFISRYEPLPKAKAGASNPVFSPDAKMVAAVVTQQGKALSWKIGIYDVDAKKEARLIDLGDAKILQYGRMLEEQSPEPIQFVPSYRTSGDTSPYFVATLVTTADGVDLNFYDPADGKKVHTLHQEKNKADGRLRLEFCISPDNKTLAVMVQHHVNGAPPRLGNPNPGAGIGGGAGGGNLGFAGGAGGVGFGGGGAANLGGGGGFGAFGAAGGAGAIPGNAPGALLGRAYHIPASGAVYVYDLEKRVRLHTLNTVPHAVRFANNQTLATIDFGDKAMKLSLWDLATAKSIGRIDGCDQVHFSRDGGTMLTRTSTGIAAGVKSWTVEAKRK